MLKSRDLELTPIDHIHGYERDEKRNTLVITSGLSSIDIFYV